MKTENSSFLMIFLFVSAIAATWYIRGEQKDMEYARSVVHKVDTTKTVREIPQPAKHVEIGPLPAKLSPQDRPAVDTAIVRALVVSVDSLKGLVRYMAARIDTTIRTDSAGSVRLRYDPLKRMAIADFTPPPIREAEIMITDSIRIPIVEHDSWMAHSMIAFTAVAVTVTAVEILNAILHRD